MRVLNLVDRNKLRYTMNIILMAFVLKLPKLDKEVELILDNCPPTFEFTEAGNKTVEEIDQAILVMEKVNDVNE